MNELEESRAYLQWILEQVEERGFIRSSNKNNIGYSSKNFKFGDKALLKNKVDQKSGQWLK